MQGRNEQLLQALYLFIFLSGLWQAQYWNSFILVYIISVDYESLFLCEGTYSKDSKSATGGNESGKLNGKEGPKPVLILQFMKAFIKTY